jgi:hypothetical protein
MQSTIRSRRARKSSLPKSSSPVCARAAASTASLSSTTEVAATASMIACASGLKRGRGEVVDADGVLHGVCRGEQPGAIGTSYYSR